jgi:hypothetical protein
VKGYCPHYGEVMELDNCYFCHFKKSSVANEKLGLALGEEKK